MNINININVGSTKNLYSPIEFYESMDVISIFGNICETIDENQIATFIIEFNGGREITLKMDFKYDFTSVMPELIELAYFLEQNENDVFFLNLYELSIKIEIEKIDENNVLICLMHRDIKKIEYVSPKKELKKNIRQAILTFRQIISSFFPKTYRIFKEENYLGF